MTWAPSSLPESEKGNLGHSDAYNELSLSPPFKHMPKAILIGSPLD